MLLYVCNNNASYMIMLYTLQYCFPDRLKGCLYIMLSLGLYWGIYTGCSRIDTLNFIAQLLV